MPLDHAPPQPAPTALSQSRKPRQELKTPHTTDSTPVSTGQILQTGHHSASQSQDLTVFSDLTEPPVSTPVPEAKGLATDIQGGLSGLYNKFKATVAGTKESDIVQKPVSAETVAGDGPSTHSSSGRTSRVQSPRVSAFDTSAKTEVPKFTPGSISVMKLNLPSPGIRSPNGLAHLAGPAVTELNIHATVNAKSHSRAGSSQGADENAQPDRLLLSPTEEQNIRKALSKAEQESRLARQDRRLHSPQPPLSKLDTKPAISTSTHSRGVSESSTQGKKDKVLQRHILTPTSASNDHPLNRLGSNKNSPIDNRSPIRVPGAVNLEEKGTNSTKTTQVPTSPPLNIRDATSRPRNRVSQSRLPGFPVSRTSSTDSGLTSATLALSKDRYPVAQDGQADVSGHLGPSRWSSRVKSHCLEREFWMKDENARECYSCGEPFTTFRRKHHCRTCGQIFDNKCTTLVSGWYFDLPGAVRVCRPCEAIIISHEDDSSDYSDDPTTADLSARPRTPDFSAARYDDDNVSVISQSLEHIARTPVMSLPVRRAYDKNNRSSAILEFDVQDHVLHRPSSSRSLRTSHTLGHGYGHKRHHSKHQHIRSFKPYHEDRVPFQRVTQEDLRDKTSAFHRDSIIDPELAQYLSDDPSSEEDNVLRPSHSTEKLSRSGPDSDRTTIGGLLAAMRKGRSRMGDRSIAGFLNFNREADDAASVVSARAIDGLRSSRKRNTSVASSIHHKMTPRSTRDRIQIVLPPGHDSDSPASPVLPRSGPRMMRSASMHGVGAPSLELNRASVQHVHKMLRQLLKDAEVPRVSHWEDALIPILLRATDDVDPDVQGGDDIDIRSYVKLKKIPGGKPGDTSYTSGLIFTKNVALKSMQRSIASPRILIITFSLEYARSESHFMSLDPVIRQEREYLGNLVARIAALKPDVVLAEKNVSGLALELLGKANIVVVYSVKRAVLEAVSRCTNTAVHNSVDRLTAPDQELGTCELFEVKTYRAEGGRRKTYIYVSGCPPELGCTIALRGASREVLDKIKRLTDFMIYVVYNLKLETCLMRDEWALIPSTDNLTRSSVTSTAQKSSKSCESSFSQTHQTTEAGHHPASTDDKSGHDHKADGTPEVKRLATNDSGDIPDDIPVPMFYQDLADKHETRILSASPFVKFSQPYLLMRAREFERRVAYFKRLRDQDLSDSLSVEEKAKAQKFTLITPEMVHSSLKGTSKKVREIVHAVHDAEYEKALFHYDQQKKQWEAHLSGNKNLFDPYAHQNIVVLFSMISTHTNIPCSGPDMVAFSFYNEHEYEEGFEPDCTLGQYVEDLCYRADHSCSAAACPKRMFEHHRQYVHGEAQITVFVEPYPPKLRGLQDVVLMWSTCKICGTETTVTPMSPSTWKYSFGKYLELSFWSADLHARAGGCQHDLHRDHLRYFGYKGFALRVHYDPIDLLEIIVPRMHITWKVDNDLRFRNDAYTKLEHRITKFMVSVKLRLKSINIEALLPESADACRTEIDRLMKQANDDHTTLIKHLQERYTNSLHWEIIPLNSAMRALQEKVADWDEAFAEFEKNFFPSEKDIRRLATIQLKKIFLDRDVSVTSLTSGEDENLSPTEAEPVDEKQGSKDESSTLIRKLSVEKTQNVLESVVEEHCISPQSTSEKIEHSSLNTPAQIDSSADNTRRASNSLQHLDLAVNDPTPKTDLQPSNPTTVPISERDRTATSPELDMTPYQLISRSSEDEQSDSALNTSDHIAANETNKSTSTPPKSQVPTPSQTSSRRGTVSRPGSPMLTRAQSQPSGSLPLRKDFSQSKPSTLSAINATNGFGSSVERKSIENTQESSEKKFSDRFGLASLKNHKIIKGQSLIPRAVSGRKESRVSNLAKHFEQLSHEFEQARLKERRERAARNRRSQIYPLAAPKPIVEVYKSVTDAVDEVDESEETLEFPENTAIESNRSMAQDLAETNSPETASHNFHSQVTVDQPSEAKTNEESHTVDRAPSEDEDRTDAEEEDEEVDEEQQTDEILLPDSPEDLLRLSQEDAEFKDLQKHERSSLLKMLTNFWAERSSSGWATLEYPLHTSDHIFTDCDIIVREDELSSIIAFALDSSDYNRMLHNIQDRRIPIHKPTENIDIENANEDEDEDVISHSLLRKTGTHLKYQFTEGPAKMLCKVFFAEQFDAMRRKCGVADRFVESLSRCMKFDSKGGKSRSLFLKTLDDRFVLKSLSPVETQSFLKFAPNYFQIMSEAFFHDLPSVIAKMLGFYQIIIKNPTTGVEHNWYLLVMENLFYDRVPTRIFDLKGSMRNRKINATGERNEVLLDENMVEFIYESPLFAREHSKKVLRSSVHNDTLFLARQNVMDYSLMIAIDEHKKELVVGIIDCIRTYTWDKKLESWIKDRGFVNAIVSASSGLGGGGGVRGTGNRPTVTSPKEYKRRFREAMSRYVLEAPGCWHQFKPRQKKVEEGERRERTVKDGHEAVEELQQTGS